MLVPYVVSHISVGGQCDESLYGVVLGWYVAGVAELAKGAGLKILFLVIRGFESLLPHLLFPISPSLCPFISVGHMDKNLHVNCTFDIVFIEITL